jgi:hypothetical protein
MIYYAIGTDGVGYSRSPSAAAISLNFKYYYDWRIDWYHRSGGIKRTFFYGLSDCITSINFEENKRLMGSAEIEFAYLDFPIDVMDRVEIFYKNTKLWEGIVSSRPDAKSGKITILPLSYLLDFRLINQNFSSQTLKSMLQSIIESTEVAETGIDWDADQVTITDTNLYSMNFKTVTAKNAIEEILKKVNNVEWGVNKGRVFSVYGLSTATFDKIITNSENKWFTELKKKVSDRRVKATRGEVFGKSTNSGQSIYHGNVGFDSAGNTYATLSIEKTLMRKDKKFTIGSTVSSSFALDLVYSDLQNQARLSTSVTLRNFRIDKFNPAIGNFIKCVDDNEIQLKTIIDCDSTSGWDAVSLESDDYVEGTNAINYVEKDSTAVNLVTYDFGEVKRYKKLDSISFMTKSNQETGRVLDFGLSTSTSTPFANSYQVNLNDVKVWEWKNIPTTVLDFRYLSYKLRNTSTKARMFNVVGRMGIGEGFALGNYNSILLDRIQVYAYDRPEYEGYVVQKDWTIDKNGVTVDVTFGDYIDQTNQELFELRKELEDMKTIQQST